MSEAEPARPLAVTAPKTELFELLAAVGAEEADAVTVNVAVGLPVEVDCTTVVVELTELMGVELCVAVPANDVDVTVVAVVVTSEFKEVIVEEAALALRPPVAPTLEYR